MVTANKVRLDEFSNWRDRFPESATILYEGKRYFVVRNAADAGPFYLMLADLYQHDGPDPLYSPEVSEPVGVAYQPLLPGTTAEDVMGATYAGWDGTHWEIAHCSPDEQVDFAAEAELYAYSQFTEAIHRNNAATARIDSNIGRNTGFSKSEALIDFARAVGRRVHHVVVSSTLGHYHREPHHDHKRELAIEGIDRILAEWQQAGVTDDDKRNDRVRVLDDANAVKTRLSSTHVIRTRAEQAALDAAAAKEEADAGDAAPDGE